MTLYDENNDQTSTEELLWDGYIKVGSKTYCEYWKKGSNILTVYNEPRTTHGLEIGDRVYATRNGDSMIGEIIGFDIKENVVIVKYKAWLVGGKNIYVDEKINKLVKV